MRRYRELKIYGKVNIIIIFWRWLKRTIRGKKGWGYMLIELPEEKSEEEQQKRNKKGETMNYEKGLKELKTDSDKRAFFVGVCIGLSRTKSKELVYKRLTELVNAYEKVKNASK